MLFFTTVAVVAQAAPDTAWILKSYAFFTSRYGQEFTVSLTNENVLPWMQDLATLQKQLNAASQDLATGFIFIKDILPIPLCEAVQNSSPSLERSRASKLFVSEEVKSDGVVGVLSAISPDQFWVFTIEKGLQVTILYHGFAHEIAAQGSFQISKICASTDAIHLIGNEASKVSLQRKELVVKLPQGLHAP
jgi:hypothetical protein